jgi:hypothetical protein
VISGEAQQLSLFVAEVGYQIHPDPIANEPMRESGQQTFGRSPEDEAQELKRSSIAEHVAQPVAEMHRRSGGGLDCLVDEVRATSSRKPRCPISAIAADCSRATRSGPRRNPRNCLRARF